MEIRLAKISNKNKEEISKIEFIDTLTQEQFENFEKSIEVIEEIHSITRLFEFVFLNNEDFFKYLEDTLHQLTKKSIVWNGVKRDDSDKVFQNCNRLFLNYLSSVRTFLDHSETFINRKYGTNGKELIEFKKITAYFYDNSFAYRFFYKLRNYSQHIGLPLDNLSFNTKYDKENNTVKGQLNVKFKTKKLLSNYKSWGTVKTDLENMSTEFEVSPLVYEMTHNIKQIKENIEVINKAELLNAVNYITELNAEFKNPEIELFIAYDVQKNKNGDYSGFTTINIPFQTINFINQKLKIK
jgi:hypothetical protein